MEFELLFNDFSAPLFDCMFFDKPQTGALVKQSRPVQPFKGPEEHLVVAGFAAEPEGPVQEKASQSPAVKSRVYDEPTEPRAFVSCPCPVNSHGAGKIAIHDGGPEAVPVPAKIADEIR